MPLQILAARHGLEVREINWGNVMGVDYADLGRVFDWDEYARLLAPLAEAYISLTITSPSPSCPATGGGGPGRGWPKPGQR